MCLHCHVYVCDYQRGFGFDIGFIDHFNTRLVTTLNYSAIADLHILKITRVHVKSISACSIFTSRFQATASNSGYPSASALTPFPAGHRLTTELGCHESELRLAVYRQSVRLCDKPLQTHDQ
jgi:hypothetical protein